MQWDTFLTTMEQIGRYLESVYLWNFGEPFLHPQIFDMIAYAHHLGITSYMSTNGTVLYSTDSIDALTCSELDYLIISLDGASPETLGQYRVGVDFDKVTEGISRLQRAKTELSVRNPMISIQFVVMKHNMAEISAIKRLAQELEVGLELKTVNVELLGTESDVWAYLPEDEGFSRYKIKDDSYQFKHLVKNDCYQVWHSLVINWNGDVVPCCRDYDSTSILGNVLEESLRQIWNGSPMQNLRKAIARDRKSLPLCRSCTLADWAHIRIEKLGELA